MTVGYPNGWVVNYVLQGPRFKSGLRHDVHVFMMLSLLQERRVELALTM